MVQLPFRFLMEASAGAAIMRGNGGCEMNKGRREQYRSSKVVRRMSLGKPGERR
jgi:hypothetical protein